MIQLDHHLLFQARRLITGANVHSVKEMIFAYEQAVDLHNRDHPGNRIYRCEHEAVYVATSTNPALSSLTE